MEVILTIGLVLGILAGGAVALIVVWQTVREQALLRRTLDISMLQVMLPKNLARDEREEGVGDQIKARIAVAEQWLSTMSNLPTSGWNRWLYGPPIVVLEMAAREDGVIVFYTGTERRYLDHLEKQVYAFYLPYDF